MVPPEMMCFLYYYRQQKKKYKQFAAGFKSATRNESNEIRGKIRGSREVAV